jgi:hypothetical protein
MQEESQPAALTIVGAMKGHQVQQCERDDRGQDPTRGLRPVKYPSDRTAEDDDDIDERSEGAQGFAPERRPEQSSWVLPSDPGEHRRAPTARTEPAVAGYDLGVAEAAGLITGSGRPTRAGLRTPA